MRDSEFCFVINTVCSFFGFLSFGYSVGTLYFHMLSHIIFQLYAVR